MGAVNEKPVSTTEQILDWIKSEVTAGMVLGVKDEADAAWNSCAQRTLRIIKQYREGKGLFQQ